jgi:hypothetical protein
MDPDPTPFFIDFMDAIMLLFTFFFLLTYPKAHYLQSKKFIFFLSFVAKFYFESIIQSAQHFLGEGKDLEPDPDPYLSLMDNFKLVNLTFGYINRYFSIILKSFKSHALALPRKGTLENLPYLSARSRIWDGLKGRIRIRYKALRIHTTNQ